MNYNKVLSSIVLGSMISTSAFATGVNVHHFYPVLNNAYIQSEDTMSFGVWGSKGQGKAFFGASVDYLNDPLVRLNSKQNARLEKLADSMSSMNLSAGYNLMKNFSLGASTAITLAHTSVTKEIAFGDTKISGKFRLTDDNAKTAMALVPFIELPTGKKADYLSNDSLGLGGKFVLEHDAKIAQFVLNLGYRFAKNSQFEDLVMKHSFPMSAGVLIPVSDRWAINAEAAGLLFAPVTGNQNDGAMWVGARYKISKYLAANAAVGLGALNDYSSSNIRMNAGLTYFESEFPQADAPQVIVKEPIYIVQKANAEKGDKGDRGDSACVNFSDPVVTATGYTLKQLEDMKKSGIDRELPYYFNPSKAEHAAIAEGKKTKKGKHEAVATIDLLSLGRHSKGLEYVKDAEVVFEFNYRLPNKKILLLNRKNIPLKAKINLEIIKKKADKGTMFNDTESICILNTKKCSGSLFHESGFVKLINPEFKMLNDVFSEELRKGIESAETTKNNSLWVTNIELDLADAFAEKGKRLSEEELVDLLYSSNNADSDKEMLEQKLKIVVSDDTLVSRAFLSINYAYDGCSLTKLEMPEKK